MFHKKAVRPVHSASRACKLVLGAVLPLLAGCAPALPALNSDRLDRIARSHPVFNAQLSDVRVVSEPERQYAEFKLTLGAVEPVTVDLWMLSLGTNEVYLVGRDAVYYTCLRPGNPAPYLLFEPRGTVALAPDRPRYVVLQTAGLYSETGPDVLVCNRGLFRSECHRIPPGQYRFLCNLRFSYGRARDARADINATPERASWLIEYPGWVTVENAPPVKQPGTMESNAGSADAATRRVIVGHT